MERKEDLFEIDTDGEQLIFPNLPSMRINYNLEEGSAAHQAITKADSDIEINITVDRVRVR